MTEPFVLGINAAYHQSAAAIVSPEGIVAAAEEERFNRVRHGKATSVDTTHHLPLQAIDYCLRAAGCELTDVGHIAYSFDPNARHERSAAIADFGPVLAGGYETRDGDRRFLALMRATPGILAAAHGLAPGALDGRWAWVGHHEAHLASAYYPSPFDTAAGLVVDGIGEAATTTLARCGGLDMEVLRTIDFPHSLGFVWELMTNFLGFEGNYDECKVMGLAAYGDPTRYSERLRRMIRALPDGGFEVDFDQHPRLLSEDYSYIESLLGGLRHRVPHEPVQYLSPAAEHADVAAALQTLTVDVMVRLARTAREATRSPYLVMAGGVALNAVANGAVAREAGFDDVWIQPAASDAGTALGAALWTLHHPQHGAVRHRVRMTSPYLGPAFDDEDILPVLDRHRLRRRRVDDPATQAAYDLARGLTVGWFQGRMEFGPRALGARSLLADPRSTDMRALINRRVKHRQDFRPFAPTILEEHAEEWFDLAGLPSAARYMLVTAPVWPGQRDRIPAAVHVDGTARMQLLRREDNPLYYRLIESFNERTGVPLVLNTSFNDREPIVCTPDDAARCFLKTQIDVMYLGHYVVEGPKPWERSDRRQTVSDDLLVFGRTVDDERAQ